MQENRKIDYIITVETLIPTTLTYQVSAYKEDEAIELVNNLIKQNPNKTINKHLHLNRMKMLKMVLKKKGSSIIEFVKNF